MTRLLVAAGGGGDAIAAAIIHAAEYDERDYALILTYAWDRLLVDPRPGPRAAADFTGLEITAPGVRQFRPSTEPIPPAGSTLPRLSAEFSPKLALLDPYEGAWGMTVQITMAAQCIGADTIEIVDVGGDALARGDEPGLRSPLADALVLAACADTRIPTIVSVAGPGLDGEIPEADVLERCGPRVLTLTRDQVEPFVPTLMWHPSEATALLVASAQGARGLCEVRDAGLPVHLTDASPTVHRLPLDHALDVNMLACALMGSTSLDQAEHITRDKCGFSELDYERNKATWLKAQDEHRYDPDSIAESLDVFLSKAADRGMTYVTPRRTAEALAVPAASVGRFREDVATVRPDLARQLLWPVVR